MKKTHKLVPCAHYDVERIESWLTDMASQGLHLEKEPTFMGFFPFAKGEPRDVRYRLEPKQAVIDNEKPDMDAEALYREYGWEYVTDYGLFYIYRSVTPDAREMNTDPQVQALAMKGIFKQLIGPLFICILALRNSISRITGGVVRFFVTFGITYAGGYFLVIFASAVLTLIRLVHLLRVHQKLKNDIPLDHSKPWRKQALFSRLSKFVGWGFYIFILVVMLTQCTQGFGSDLQIGQYTEDPPFVTISDLCPQGSYTLHNGDVYNTVTVDESFLAPLYMEWHEDADVLAPDGSTVVGRLDVIYYEAQNTWLAEQLAKEFYKRAQGAYAFGPWETPELDIDYAIAYTAQNSGHPTIIMQQGNVMVQGYIDIFDDTGYNYLTEWATQMADMLK